MWKFIFFLFISAAVGIASVSFLSASPSNDSYPDGLVYDNANGGQAGQNGDVMVFENENPSEKAMYMFAKKKAKKKAARKKKK